jgi:hypothetical protein
MIDKIGPAPNADPVSATQEETRTSVEAGLRHLAAAAMAEGWMEKIRARNGERSVSANELTSLSALIVYVAHMMGASEFRIERDLADRFGVPNVKCLPSSRFDDAIRYLVDRVPATA